MVDVDPADFVGLSSLYAKYNWASDEGDGEAWAECFVEDATFAIDGKEWRTGRDELVRKRREPLDGQPRQHWNTNLYFQLIGPGVVRGRAELLALDVVNGEPKVMMVGSYDDTVVKTDEGWKFRRRELTAYYSRIEQQLFPAAAKD